MIFNNVRREFIAKLVADIGKAIFAVGLASYLFEKFPSNVKIILWISCAGCVVGSIFIHPKNK